MASWIFRIVNGPDGWIRRIRHHRKSEGEPSRPTRSVDDAGAARPTPLKLASTGKRMEMGVYNWCWRAGRPTRRVECAGWYCAVSPWVAPTTSNNTRLAGTGGMPSMIFCSDAVVDCDADRD
jgi:hypothetical protein